MPRLRGPKLDRPEGDTAWPLLNAQLFGSNDRGGLDVPPDPDVLPVDWAAVFGRDAPRTLEIGFNRARFLKALAVAWPDHDHVGIEVRRRYGWLFANEVGAAGEPRNVRVVWGDAKILAPALFAPGSLAAVFINFPDPWWKRRHAKRRLVDTDFAASIRDLLSEGGRVYVKSDVQAIADEIDAALAGTEGLGERAEFGEADLPLTFREVKCVAAQMPIWRYSYGRYST